MYRQLLILLVITGCVLAPGRHRTTRKPGHHRTTAKGDHHRHHRRTTKRGDHQSNRSYKLVWSEKFKGNSLDENSWEYEESCSHNMEIQCSTKRREANVRIENGHLVIEARPERFKNRHFTSGRIHTTKMWTYGLFQVRARLPKGKDLCPNIWLWPPEQKYGSGGESGSMNIVLYKGDEPHRIASCMRFGGDWGHMVDWTDRKTFPRKDFSKEFHTFAMEWTPAKMVFAVDGKVYARRDIAKNLWGGHGRNPYTAHGQPFDRPFMLVIHLSVGGEYCGQGSVSTEEANNWPKSTLEIEWVKVFQKK